MAAFGDIKQIARHGSIYAIGIIFGKVISFVMIPLYTNLLTPADYGVLQLLSLTIDVISTLVGIGMTSAVMRFYYKYDDEENRKLSVSSALIGVLLLMTICTAVSIIFSDLFSKLVFSSIEYTLHFKIIFLTMFLSAGVEIPLVYIRARQRSIYFVIINTIRLTLNLGLNIYFLVVLDMGVLGVLYSGLITSVLVCAYLLYYTFRETGLKFNYGIFKEMAVFGGPILLSNLAAFLLTFADHFILNKYDDLATVGLYSLAYKFGILVSVLFIAPFQQIWGAKMFEVANKEDARETISRVFLYFILIATTISLALSVLTKDFLRIIANESYWDAYILVPVISFAYVLNGMIYIVNIGILITDKTKYVAISTFIAMIINIILNFLLIPKYGGYGAAYSTLFAYLVRFLLVYRYSQKLYKINYGWANASIMMVLYIILVCASMLLNIENRFVSIAYNSILLVVFPLVIYMTNIFNPDEKKYIRRFIRNPVNTFRALKGG